MTGFDIRTVSYTARGAPAAFTRSLRETGFAVLTGHPIGPERIRETYAAWGKFFNSADKQRYAVKGGADPAPSRSSAVISGNVQPITPTHPLRS